MYRSKSHENSALNYQSISSRLTRLRSQKNTNISSFTTLLNPTPSTPSSGNSHPKTPISGYNSRSHSTCNPPLTINPISHAYPSGLTTHYHPHTQNPTHNSHSALIINNTLGKPSTPVYRSNLKLQDDGVFGINLSNHVGRVAKNTGMKKYNQRQIKDIINGRNSGQQVYLTCSRNSREIQSNTTSQIIYPRSTNPNLNIQQSPPKTPPLPSKPTQSKTPMHSPSPSPPPPSPIPSTSAFNPNSSIKLYDYIHERESGVGQLAGCGAGEDEGSRSRSSNRDRDMCGDLGLEPGRIYSVQEIRRGFQVMGIAC